MSIAGGLHNAFGHAIRAGCRTLQIFLKNHTQWKEKERTAEDCALYHSAWEASGLEPVLAHNSYLINLASPDDFLYERSVRAFVDELERANSLLVAFVILHPGAHMGAGEERG